MTKCSKDEANLKSTAYNQTGQNFFEQLSAYNSMTSHLRRILLAKSVIDARNKTYVSKIRKLCKSAEQKSQPLAKDIAIDKPARNNRHRSTDELRMNFKSKRTFRKGARKCFDCYDNNEIKYQGAGVQNDGTCYGESNRATCRNRSRSRTNRSASVTSNNRQTKSREDLSIEPIVCYSKRIKSTNIKPTSKTQNYSPEQRYEDDSFESVSDYMTQETNRLSPLSNFSDIYDDTERLQKCEENLIQAKTKDEESKYAEFVYEITREIMSNGLYTDEELHQVFKKHIEINKGTLNTNKMLYEIYQLKISLNVSDESDVDDEIEDLIHAQQLLSVSEIRPPTPPKVLNDNKVLEKLMSYETVLGSQRRSSNGTKSVILVDANPELLITERDVLSSLIEADIDPKQAQQICKSLFHKSRNTLEYQARLEAERGNDESTMTGSTNVKSENNTDELTEKIDGTIQAPSENGT